MIDKSRYPADCGCGATRVPSSQGKENGARPAKGPPHGIESRLCGSGGPFELPRTLMSRLERAKPPQVMDIDMRGVGQSQESVGRATAETLVQPPAKYGSPRAHGDRPAASLSRVPVTCSVCRQTVMRCRSVGHHARGGLTAISSAATSVAQFSTIESPWLSIWLSNSARSRKKSLADGRI